MSDPVVLITIAIIVLLFLSAFFSGAETALTAASRPRMHELERDGNRRAGMVNQLRRRQERLIGSILVGNNLVNILASALATSVLIRIFGDAGVAYATLIMTLLVLVFAEVLPKTYAIRHADRVALHAAPMLRPVIAALSPITRLIEFLVRALLELAGDHTAGNSRRAHEQELRGAIGLHARTGEVAADEGRMLRAVLELDDIEVGDIMTHRSDVEMVDADQSPQQIVAQVLNSPFTRLPLYRGEPNNVIGVLNAKALLREVHDHDGHIDEMNIPAVAAAPWFVPESTDCLSQLQAFRQRREHLTLVIDEYGVLQGVVTLEDIVEEIVGDVDDEHDPHTVGVDRQSDGSYIVDGRVTIRDFNRELGSNLPDDDAATVAGLVLHQARLIPEEGQTFAFFGFRFDVLQREANQIRTLRISRGYDEDDGAPAAPADQPARNSDPTGPATT